MGKWSITQEERNYLRELAKKQLEIANLPIMEKRRKQWFDLNTGKPAIPPVVIETWTFNQDFMPYEKIMKTQSPAAVNMEWQLLCNIRNHELLDDDKVIPPCFRISWQIDVKKYGIDLEVIHANDPGIAYQYKHPIKDLKQDMEKIKPSQIIFNRDDTLEWRDFVSETIGDILPPVIEGEPGTFSLTQNFIVLMGMENFFYAIYDEPEAVHELMRFLTDDYIRVAKWKEENGLLTIRNSFEDIISSHLFTDELPSPGYDGKVRLIDSWIWAESQETVGVSPDMFEEFCLPYYAEVCSLMGKIYYGCCEPVHGIYDRLLKKIPNIKKFSISKWCDEKIMGEALRENKIVYSRKPDPTYVGVGGPQLDEDAWRSHVRATLDAAKGCQVEFIMRDIYSTCGNLNKAKRAVEIAREEAEGFLD